ncbi:T9SS type A sorting domain-containing protein [Pontibacter mangrovi]|uniref:T9SS type A sorting domain-containing protein n=1 Tax=Pontibacter mangrovi TaxID=2589816 RepID=A0A501W9Y4_9BACT|nr:T9SS type A sorting domain-containing protein [Pontibacter mangrovi]TPE45160.1 T9SS type A sorting domain-containing protein [Pontibacter mangrovi]
MKNTFTLLGPFFALLAFLIVTPSALQAQGLEEGVCRYEDDCLFIEFVAIQEESPTSTELLVVMSAILGESGRCSTIDGLILSPVGGLPTLVTREDLEENDNFIELTVNRALFTATPDVVVASFQYFRLPFIGFEFPIPTDIVDMQARLDSDDPCLPITPLPVELATFTGKATQSGISLEWETASETNNSHFEVERSTDGVAFEQLARVEGHGNSITAIRYTYLDKHPLPGLSYYRLRQVDFDGQYEFSKIISVKAQERSGTLQVEVWPNPCQSGDCALNISTAEANQPVRVQLRDLTGRVVFEQSFLNDDTPIQLTQQQLEGLQGVFILSAEAGQEVTQQRLVLE